MPKVFGNVKGFDDAVSLLSTAEKGQLMTLMINKSAFVSEFTCNTDCDEHPVPFERIAIALAAIYHANNEDE